MDEDFVVSFQLNDGRRVNICLQDEPDEVLVREPATDKTVGIFQFRTIEGPSGDMLKLAYAYMDRLDKSYKRQGIGREICRLINDRHGLPVVANDHDGHEQDDGSHLTEDAPAFVDAMRREGLIVPSTDIPFDDE